MGCKYYYGFVTSDEFTQPRFALDSVRASPESSIVMKGSISARMRLTLVALGVLATAATVMFTVLNLATSL